MNQHVTKKNVQHPYPMYVVWSVVYWTNIRKSLKQTIPCEAKKNNGSAIKALTPPPQA